MMKRHIQLTAHARKKLAGLLGVSDSYIYDAIYYRRNGDFAKRIRETAIALGGRYVDPEFAPVCQTEYLEGQIRHTFASGVVMTVDMKTCAAVITVNDEVVRRQDATNHMPDLNVLALEAQNMAVQRVISE